MAKTSQKFKSTTIVCKETCGRVDGWTGGDNNKLFFKKGRERRPSPRRHGRGGKIKETKKQKSVNKLGEEQLEEFAFHLAVVGLKKILQTATEELPLSVAIGRIHASPPPY